MVCSGVATEDGECQCVPCEISGAIHFLNIMLLPVPSLFIMFAPINSPVPKMGIGVVSNSWSSLKT